MNKLHLSVIKMPLECMVSVKWSQNKFRIPLSVIQEPKTFEWEGRGVCAVPVVTLHYAPDTLY